MSLIAFTFQVTVVRETLARVGAGGTSPTAARVRLSGKPEGHRSHIRASIYSGGYTISTRRNPVRVELTERTRSRHILTAGRAPVARTSCTHSPAKAASTMGGSRTGIRDWTVIGLQATPPFCYVSRTCFWERWGDMSHVQNCLHKA